MPIRFELLDGEEGPFRDIVTLNASAALIVSDRAQSMREDGVQMAEMSIDPAPPSPGP